MHVDAERNTNYWLYSADEFFYDARGRQHPCWGAGAAGVLAVAAKYFPVASGLVVRRPVKVFTFGDDASKAYRLLWGRR